MNKGTNAGEIEELLKISGECGLHNCVYMIQGFPTQTQEDIARDVKFLKRNLQYINDITVHRFWLEAGTDIFRNRKKLGLKHLKRSSLLKTKRYNLFSPEFSFTSKEKIDWVALSRTFNDNLKAKEILERNTRLQGILFPLEHILLYAAHGKKQSLLT